MSENKKPLAAIVDELRAKHIFTSQTAFNEVANPLLAIIMQLSEENAKLKESIKEKPKT